MKKNFVCLLALSVLVMVMAFNPLSCKKADDFIDPEKEDPTYVLPEYQIPTDPSQWRGLNKLAFYVITEYGTPYDEVGLDIRESDFALMRQMGFNFLRVPMDYQWFYDYRTGTFKEEHNGVDYFARLDKMMQYGKKYSIHIELCLWTAPGWTRASDPSGWKLFTSPMNGLPHFIKVWEEFATRYKDLSNDYIDFNLVNEPELDDVLTSAGVINANCIKVLSDTINAIRKISPDRMIVVDANARHPLDLTKLTLTDFGELENPTDNILQSPHCYFPWSVTHEGMGGGTQFPKDFTNKKITWPITNYFNGQIYGPGRNSRFFGKNKVPAVFNHPTGFNAGTAVLKLSTVSGGCTLKLDCDGVEKASLVVGGGDSSTTKSFTANAIPAGTKKVEIYVSSGDWVMVDKFTISGNLIDCTNVDWGYPPIEMTVGVTAVTGKEIVKQMMFPEDKWEGVPAMVGEMSSLTKSGTGATWRAKLFADYVDAMYDLGIGWAFWEFKGGAMCIFNLESNVVHTQPIEITYGDGQKITYYYDKKWHDAIKHRLDLPGSPNWK
jgi:aryl-phospho-beta-D-glucosidase BglC (GH1 family)